MNQQTWLEENGDLVTCPREGCNGKLYINNYGFLTREGCISDKVIQCYLCAREWEFKTYVMTGSLVPVRHNAH